MATAEVATSEGPSTHLSGGTADLNNEAHAIALNAAAVIVEGVAIAQQVPAGEIPSSFAVQQPVKGEKEDQCEEDSDSDDDFPKWTGGSPRGKMEAKVSGKQSDRERERERERKEKEKEEKERKEKEEKEKKAKEKRERDAKGKAARK